jgi:hypothetical protein
MDFMDFQMQNSKGKIEGETDGGRIAALIRFASGGVLRFFEKRRQAAAVQEAGAAATRRVGDRRSNLAGSVRFGPAGTAWDRLGPDKFFSPRRKMSPKSQVQGPKPSFEEIRLSAGSRHAWSVTQVVDISSGMAKSCAATDWFSAPCGENRRFSTHLSPLSRLIYRLLRRFCLFFLFAAHSAAWRRLIIFVL